MLNLGNIEIERQYATEREAIESMRSYIYQLYIEINFRLDELDKRIKELENETNEYHASADKN